MGSRWESGTERKGMVLEELQIGTQIRKYRSDMGISQETLAERVYVSRQTVSNWETGKNYPDIHSLLLLSVLFSVSLDKLIKGDVEIMEKEIKEAEIKRFKRYGNIYAVLLFLMIVSAPPAIWISWYGLIPWGVLFAVTMYFAFKVEGLKKDYNIFTYREIVAFMEGKRLDEIQKQREFGKRPYQRVLLVLGSAAFGVIVCCLMAKLFFHH